MNILLFIQRAKGVVPLTWCYLLLFVNNLTVRQRDAYIVVTLYTPNRPNVVWSHTCVAKFKFQVQSGRHLLLLKGFLFFFSLLHV